MNHAVNADCAAVRTGRQVVDCAKAGAEVVGVAIAIEKCFSGAGDRMRARGVRIESLAMIESMSENGIVFRS